MTLLSAPSNTPRAYSMGLLEAHFPVPAIRPTLYEQRVADVCGPIRCPPGYFWCSCRWWAIERGWSS